MAHEAAEALTRSAAARVAAEQVVEHPEDFRIAAVFEQQFIKPLVVEAPAHIEGVGVAQWWDSTALLGADYANGRVRFDGTSYADEASFNTALGVTKSSEQRSFPVYVDPAATELLTDGGFASGVDSWASTPATTANGSLAQVSSQLVATETTTGYKFSRPVTLAADTPYRLLMDRIGSTGSVAGVFIAGTGAVELTGATSINHSGAGTKELDFSDDATAQYVGWTLTGTGTIPDTSATAINAVKAALLAGAWVGHSLDGTAQAALQTTMDSDAMRSDTIHCNDLGHAAVKSSVKGGLQAVGLA